MQGSHVHGYASVFYVSGLLGILWFPLFVWRVSYEYTISTAFIYFSQFFRFMTHRKHIHIFHEKSSFLFKKVYIHLHKFTQFSFALFLAYLR